MKAKLHYVFSLAIFLITFSISAQNKYFHKINGDDSSLKNAKSIFDKVSKEKVFEFNYLDLSRALSTASDKNSTSSKSSSLVISFPNLNGEFENYLVFEASVMHPDLQAKYPEIRSYVGYGIDSPTSYLRFSLSPYKGLSGIVISGENNESMIINPFPGDTSKVVVGGKSKNGDKNISFFCGTIANMNDSFKTKNSIQLNKIAFADATLHTFDLALSVTGEYTQYHGGTKIDANAAMVATITRVNGIFETDFNVTMVLIANNDDIVYTDPNTDPYSPNTTGQDPHPLYGGSPWFANNWNVELQDGVLTPIIGEANYDFGHLFASDGGGGNAGCIGCVCESAAHIGGKGSAYTSPKDGIPEGDTFDIDFVAHEMGYQFGANHTFSFNSEFPDSDIAQMEPGSGSTIMGYAGITGETDVQSHSDPYFHAISIQQVTAHVATRTCDIETATGNNIPTVSAGSNLTLPIGTPFKLVGSATDADATDVLTYCWEQFNEDNALNAYPNPTSTSNDKPLFRSYSPSTSPIRIFPKLTDLLNTGVNGTTWEKIPTVARSANFRLTVRDNKIGGGSNSFGDNIVNWDSSKGPFEVTSQASTGISWVSGSTETITWNVNNTNSMTGASNVNILLSTDGGLTYPTTLKSNTPNDGTENITVPNIPATYCRIMVEPTNNNFFAINSKVFAIDYLVVPACDSFTSTDSNLPITITDNGSGFTETSFVNVPVNVSVTNLKLTVNITHPYPGDVLLGLQSPSGTLLTVLEPYSPCQNEDINIVATFDDSGTTLDCGTIGDGLTIKSPVSSFSGWNGENASGNWVLGLGDGGAGDIGNLNSWSIEVCYDNITPLSISEFDLADFKVFPNPNKGEFTIKLHSNSSKINIDVYDLRGRVIYKNNYANSGDFNEKINLNHIQSGVYILKVSDGLRKSTKKLVVE